MLQSACREFLASHALDAVGVPTTHSLAVVAPAAPAATAAPAPTPAPLLWGGSLGGGAAAGDISSDGDGDGDSNSDGDGDGGEFVVYRDEFYQGSAAATRAGVLTRVSPSFLRFGSFQVR